jgi:hypothetical protein
MTTTQPARATFALIVLGLVLGLADETGYGPQSGAGQDDDSSRPTEPAGKASIRVEPPARSVAPGVITAPRDGANLAPRAEANFTISGDLPGSLEPGLSQPLDLALTNPGPSEISISHLLVSIESIHARQADEAHPCTLEDFSVAQFSGAYGFKLGAAETSRLSELGFPEKRLPRVTMLDRPVNQDGCKRASLTFSYSGTSTGSG